MFMFMFTIMRSMSVSVCSIIVPIRGMVMLVCKMGVSVRYLVISIGGGVVNMREGWFSLGDRNVTISVTIGSRRHWREWSLIMGRMTLNYQLASRKI